ncbi:hypothetical protein OZX65_06690 [Leuconostocaceae bacterium ESL0723]|nr:hypothetical protein OZX65_06690 [Leuconostocaceae bacterium ESL0723]
MPINLTINKKYLIVAWVLVILGVAGAINMTYPWGDFATPICGLVGLFLLIGAPQVKEILQPMRKPYWLKLIGFYLLSYVIEFGILGIGGLFGQFSFDHATGDNAVSNFKTGALLIRLLKILPTSVEIVGEELVMAVVTLSIFYFLKNKNHGWLLASLLGCLAFAAMHLWAYDFQIWVCLSVGFSRLPFNLAWRATNSLRSAVYIHLASDLLILIPVAIMA